ncbi:site-specific DNA-methyltransferase [bacterium]|nr:site-specific DNA-methyltransferase [bacterium]
MKSDSSSRLFHGDNLTILKKYFSDKSVDLIYMDPPFNSNRCYNVLPGKKTNTIDSGNEQVFDDTWRWNDSAVEAFNKITSETDGQLSQLFPALKRITGESGMLAYLLMMAPRIVELRRTLKHSGSIYIHCDQRASAYLKLLMDAVFGAENFLNCIVWCYGLGGSSPRYWPRKHDDILWYSREQNGHYFEAVQIPATSQKMKGQFKKAPDFWNIPTINNMAHERVGYPTQKPEALLARIIESSSCKGDIVLDPFCGCGTTLVVAQALSRKWIGIDSSEKAVELVKKRLEGKFGEG